MSEVRFAVLRALLMTIRVLCYMTPCRLVNGYRPFKGASRFIAFTVSDAMVVVKFETEVDKVSFYHNHHHHHHHKSSP
jgi:hypothetical protein